MATGARVRRKSRAIPEAVADPVPYADPGWISRAADMVAPWGRRGPSWVEREAAHLRARIEAWRGHPGARPEDARRLLHDAELILLGLLTQAESGRAVS